MAIMKVSRVLRSATSERSKDSTVTGISGAMVASVESEYPPSLGSVMESPSPLFPQAAC
jgi:hypothetical protein